MHTGVYTQMSTELPTKFDVLIPMNHGKLDSAHEHVHESVPGCGSCALFSHVLSLAQIQQHVGPENS